MTSEEIREAVIEEIIAFRFRDSHGPAAEDFREFAQGSSTNDLVAMAREGKMSLSELVRKIAEHGHEYFEFYAYEYPSGGYEFLPYRIQCPWEFGNPVLVFDHFGYSNIPEECDDSDSMIQFIEQAIQER